MIRTYERAFNPQINEASKKIRTLDTDSLISDPLAADNISSQTENVDKNEKILLCWQKMSHKSLELNRDISKLPIERRKNCIVSLIRAGSFNAAAAKTINSLDKVADYMRLGIHPQYRDRYCLSMNILASKLITHMLALSEFEELPLLLQNRARLYASGLVIQQKYYDELSEEDACSIVEEIQKNAVINKDDLKLILDVAMERLIEKTAAISVTN